MPTNADHLATVRSWQRWHVANEDVRIAEASDRHAQAVERRAARDEISGDPLRAMFAARKLIEVLSAERRDMVTDARHLGASWDEIAIALEESTDLVRREYADLVNCISDHCRGEISNGLLDRHQGRTAPR